MPVHRYTINGGLDVPIPPWIGNTHTNLRYRELDVPCFPGSPLSVHYRVFYSNDNALPLANADDWNLAVFNQHAGVTWRGDIVILRMSRTNTHRFVNMRAGDAARSKLLVQMYVPRCNR